MNAVRMSIMIPRELAQQLDEVIGPRKKSKFIAEVLRKSIREIEEQKLRKALEEGYKGRREESLSLAREFEHVDLEGWDEY
jgi:metal-responsive CopG/Arc/MetJ family transcriptional regulator